TPVFFNSGWTSRLVASTVLDSIPVAGLRRGSTMKAHPLQTWIARRLLVRQRLARVCTSYVLFLMVVTTKHTLEEAARFSGLHKSLFSKMLQSHAKVAVSTLENLSQKQAKHLAKSLHALQGLPWKIAILLD